MEHPLLYEINTRCWLRELSERHRRLVTLADVPEEEFATWRRLGFTHIWLMGVWTTGARAREIALSVPDLRCAYDEVLPRWTDEDVAGSPYSIADYSVPAALGGEAGLKQFRAKLKQCGLKLILDFVPNHLGVDHPWVTSKPEVFVQSEKQVDGTFEVKTANGTRWLAYGKDPYFPGWTDTAQVDYRHTTARAAMQELLLSVASKCDGVRCDMAMLLLNEVMARTWSHLPSPGPALASEFWSDAIPVVKRAQPGFLFMAEVYWGLEGRLQSLGFDYTYDKALYDDLIGRNPAEAQRKLLTHPADYVTRSVHFLENHDEHRVAEKLSSPENRAAALAILGLPGMRFLHEGQLTGARLKLPVQLGRRPVEAVQTEIQEAYEKLLTTLKRTAVGHGVGCVLSPRAAWEGNPTGQNFVVVQWQAQAPAFELVVVNLAAHRSQCYVPLTVPGIAERHWVMSDLLGAESYERVGSDIAQQGLYLDLPPHGAQVFHFKPKA
ncbi:MAG: alpha-amylase family glycosyl hydrolase [Verrucomicrobiota bacterium]